jgi:hypothetical protein
VKWTRDPGDRLSLTTKVNGHTFNVGVVHGGGWLATHYGPRGGMLNGEYFYGQERARHAREWCEKRLYRLERTKRHELKTPPARRRPVRRRRAKS